MARPAVSYEELVRAQCSLVGELPDVDIVYRNLRLEVDVPLEKSGTKGIPTVGGALAGMVTAPISGAVNLGRRAFTRGGEPRRPTTRCLAVLDGVSGTLRAGTMTLVLAAAGHGKSTLLKSVSQRLVARVSDEPADPLAPLPPNTLCGTLTYAGSSVTEAEAAGVSVPRLVAYVPQTDEHYPSLTVAETLHFAAANVRAPWVPSGQQHEQGHKAVSTDASSPRESAADVCSASSALACEQAAAALADPAVAVAQVLRLLKLEECEHTVLGNEVLKGCSGGQRKRVTIAESLLGHARVLCLDEISNGLDASMTAELVGCLRTWARAMRGTVLATLQQPTPEAFGLFDGLILLREGRVLYHGPRDRVGEYFRSLGFAPPAETAPPAAAGPPAAAPQVAEGQIDHHADLADWLVELCSHPQVVWARSQPGDGAVRDAPGALDTTAALAAAWARHCGADGCLDTRTLRVSATTAAGGDIQSGAAPVADTVHLRGATPASLTSSSASAPASVTPADPCRPALALTTDFARAQFGLAYPRSHWGHLRLLIGRQLKLTRRDLPFLFARVGGGIIMALVLGSLFYRTGLADFGLKLGCALFAIIHISFGSGIEVPAIIDQRFVQYKQLAARMYPAYCSVLGYWLALFPITVVETAAFSAILYFMAGFSEAAGRFFYFLLVLLSVALCEGAYFRLIAYLAPTLEQGNVLTGPLVSLQVVFAGYLITYEHLPRWLVWLFWLSPLSYALRAISRNELNDPAYDAPSPLGGDLATYFLSTYQFQPEQLWLWGSVVVLLGAALGLTTAGALALTYVRYDRSIGSSRATAASAAGDAGASNGGEAEDGEGAEGARSPTAVAVDVPETHLTSAASLAAGAAVAYSAQSKPEGVPTGVPAVVAPGGVSLGSPASSTSAPLSAAAPATRPGAVAGIRAASALPFAPASLAFSGICYDVPLPRKAGGGSRRLLRGVSGYARPGTLTLLMGSSGAGKTTLLDAIAGRKNSGTLAGSVHLGGQRVSKQVMGRSTAFVEQLDSHHSLTTVREALLFSAELRLPPTVTRAQREAFVAEILDILDLTPLQHRLVGQPNADGLSASQMKRLSIGVELAGNCPLVFLDEPTTGLSSAGAESVMRAMRRLADSGRTVISTIHQPSAAIYRMADMLLLLQKGGYQVYFGPVGEGGGAVVTFLAEAAGGVHASAGAADAVSAGTGPSAPHRGAAGSAGGGTRIPYFQAAPQGMNPASYMLEALGREVDYMAGAEQPSAHAAGGKGDADTAVLPGAVKAPSSQLATDEPDACGVVVVGTAEGTPPAPGETVGPVPTAAVHTAAIAPSVSVPDGGLYAAYWASCELQSRTAAALQALIASEAQASTRSLAAGERALPDFARSFPAQLWVLLRRTWFAYWRNVAYNATRIVVLCALALIFGLVYLRISDGDIAGVQSKISVIFLTLSFGAVLNYSTPLPVLERERPMVYRERSSGMYSSWAYSLATALVEVPYVGFICLCFTAIYYPMVGLAADASTFFAYVLTLWQLSITFVFLGHLFVFAFPSVAIAQAAAGTIVSAYFLLAGLFAPYPALPRGWVWFYRINPIAYGLEALVTPQFWCEGAGCPTISLPVGAATVQVPLYSYLSSYFGLDYGMRWRDVGILFGFMLGFLALSGASLRYITWVKR